MHPSGRLSALAVDVRQLQYIVADANIAIAQLTQKRDNAQSKRYACARNYYDLRQKYTLSLLAELNKAYCTYCKRIRHINHMRIMQESGNILNPTAVIASDMSIGSVKQQYTFDVSDQWNLRHTHLKTAKSDENY